MKSTSILKTDDTHAEELGIVEMDGREFTAGGFWIDVEKGRMLAYVTQDAEPPAGFPYLSPELWLTTWGGEKLVRLARVGRARGFNRTKLECFTTKAPIAGYHWYGRGLGVGMSLRLKRASKA